MELSDKVICDLLKNKPKEGLKALYDKYYGLLVTWADTFLNNMPASEDLVEDFFVAIWEKGTLKQISAENLKYYLYTSVRNKALNHLEKRDPLKDVWDIELVSPVWEEYDDSIDKLIAQVMKAVEQLPPRSQEIIKCVYLKGMKYQETAQFLNISIATVKTLLVNSLKSLRKTFGPDIEIFLLWILKKTKKHSTVFDFYLSL